MSAGEILANSVDQIGWLPQSEVRNGLVVAYIKLGNYTGAQNALRKFAGRTSEDTFRERLISSYLVFADTTLRRRMGWQ